MVEVYRHKGGTYGVQQQNPRASQAGMRMPIVLVSLAGPENGSSVFHCTQSKDEKVPHCRKVLVIVQMMF
jgi:hypothetical protein